MKGKENDFVKGAFTKYVETAVKRSRKDYINREKRRKDLPTETELWDEMGEMDIDLAAYYQDRVDEIPWEAEVIRRYMKDSVDCMMWRSLSGLTDLEVQVVFAKVFRQLTFGEIGRRMGEKSEKMASVYSYALKKIRKGWRKNGN